MSKKAANRPDLAIVPEGEIVDAEPTTEQEQAPYFPLLQVWRETLKHAAGELDKRVTPTWAMRITSMYKELKISEMDVFKIKYFTYIDALYKMVLDEIESDSDSLKWFTPEEDREENRPHYLALLTNWQLALLQWELAWQCTDEHAHVEIAAISEVHKMFFGETGLTAQLDAIGFEYTEADQENVAAALNALREEVGGE